MNCVYSDHGRYSPAGIITGVTRLVLERRKNMSTFLSTCFILTSSSFLFCVITFAYTVVPRLLTVIAYLLTGCSQG